MAREATFVMKPPRLNGLACPQCGCELWDTQPNITLDSYPPRKYVACTGCGYRSTDRKNPEKYGVTYWHAPFRP